MKNFSNYIKLLIITLAIGGFTNSHAQQEPQYTQYMFNMMSVNPAYTGTREGLNALLVSRWQWVGVDGAPNSHTLALHSPIKNRKIGIGGSVISDKIGPVKNTYINFNYAHRVNVTEKIKLSLGLKAGIYNYYVGLTDLDIIDQDNSFSQDLQRYFQPNLGFGAYLYSSKYYLGFSVPKFIKTDLTDIGTKTDFSNELVRHFYLTAGYIFKINDDWVLKPSVFSKMVQGAPPSLDITAQTLYKEKIWLGTTYRVGDALAFLFEYQVTNQLAIGYSYDYTISAMSNISNGSHEILISYDFIGLNKGSVLSPRYF